MRWLGLLLCVWALACGDTTPGDEVSADASMDGRVGPGVDAGWDSGTLEDAASEDAASEDAALEPAPLRRVLFLGNSYTFYNDLPMVVAQIGAASATPLEVEAITQGGAILYDHWTTTGGRERIEMGELDAVVLQGQSLEAGGKGFVGASRLFAEILVDPQTVWFATWARHESDPMFSIMHTPAQMTDRIDRGYRVASEINGDVVARVGAAWEVARLELPEVRLHDTDGSHPRPEGTLLAACVIHQAITGRTPRLPDPPPLGVDADVAEALCAIASRVRCPFESAECGGECVDVVWNPLHCGGCGVECAGEDPCLLGECGCSEGYTGCDRSCRHLPSDPGNCGGCGVICVGGEVCSDGACLCEPATPQPITLAELPGCDSWDSAGPVRLACSAGAHAHCAAQACFDSGYGPPNGHAPRIEQVMCVQGEVRTTTLAELATYEPTCADSLTQSCTSAIHRYCRAVGAAASGFGPIAETATDLSVTCIPSGTVVATTIETLQGFTTRCVPHPISCGVAAWTYCESLGHPGGFGPVEVDGSDTDVVCFDD